jgi:hypothetical protein
MLSPTFFEPRVFILGIQLYMPYGMFYMYRCEQHQIAHTGACETYHTTYTIESPVWNHEFRNI